MKKLISLLFLIPAAIFAAAGDIKIDRKNASDNAWISTIFAKQNNAVFVTDGSGVPALSTSPTLVGLTLSGQTTGRIAYYTTGGQLTSSAELLFDGSKVTIGSSAGTRLLLAGVTDGNNGVIQLPNNTTIAGGIGFGPTRGLYKDASNRLVWQETNASLAAFRVMGANGQDTSIEIQQQGGVSQIKMDGGTNELRIYVPGLGTRAVEINSTSGNANFYGAEVGRAGLGWGVTSTATAAGTTTLTSTSTQMQIFTGSTTQNITLTAANVRGSGVGCVFIIKNRSSGNLTVNRAGSDTIDGGTSDTITTNASKIYVSDGSTAWTVN